ncbi:MAG: phosphatidylcholine/phosphatidylserine synthase [Sphingobium sp.]|uniref:Phosphatidylcholine/phosphatidylserine synthase n=2 Tax=Sphingobium yanoikuyae TaxID=13690 RepID=A0A3G2UUE4_SPHYA|nr:MULTISPECIES: phosphatidylcholine/phosphatidylserine synthase [Sphingobium]AYO76201.1 phosphatidylcholine/phosphatidylserine synthase [Sphingobium yanoikuyae]PZU69811.1 MAG: phosphatidylcholine/phosphatidylserine synthase [Sphingobium sp.]RSU55950.1 phosphatidylcholine/phosphatidylserine synthase [Sphingobium yanoikuyae]
MRQRRAVPRGLRRGITLRMLAPNAVTAMALCFGLTGVRYGISGEWERAVLSILFAGVLDGLDGRIARMLRGESRFGAELDSLSDSIAFGVAPALILYLWSLHAMPKFGWIFALAHALSCALRLARFNANIDVEEQPHKSAGFLTGVPAPAGAGLTFVPLYLWMVTGEEIFRAWYVVAPWTAFVAFLMISSIATYSWSALRLRKRIRLELIAFVGLLAAALATQPWFTLLLICGVYVLLIPFGILSYAKVRKQPVG